MSQRAQVSHLDFGQEKTRMVCRVNSACVKNGESAFQYQFPIDYFNGISQGRNQLALNPDKFISIATWMLILVSAVPAEQSSVDYFLLGFSQVSLDTHVSVKAVALRKLTRVKLLDAVIWTTAQVIS